MMHFLKFPDQATYEALLTPVAGMNGQSMLVAPAGLTLDAFGTIYTGGTYDAQGKVLTAPVAQPGYHVNAIGDLPAAWLPYEIPRPVTPTRIFAGF